MSEQDKGSPSGAAEDSPSPDGASEGGGSPVGGASASSSGMPPPKSGVEAPKSTGGMDAQPPKSGDGPPKSMMKSMAAGPPPTVKATGSGAFGPPDITAVPSKEGGGGEGGPPTLVQSQTGAKSTRQAVGDDEDGGGAEGGGGAPPPPAEMVKSMKKTAAPPAGAGKRKKGEKANMSNCRIGFLGAGKIAEAIVKGLLKYSKIPANRICVSSKSGRTLDHFKQDGCIVTKRCYDLFAKLDCDVFFVAVHGHVIRAMFKTGGARPMALTTNYIPNQRHPIYLLSLVGGVPLGDIKMVLLNPDHPEKYKLEMHRIMLNTSVAYGLGLGAIDAEPDSKKCAPLIRDLLTSFAKIEYLPEATMDAACALGGNGLAFVHYFISALSDGGFKMGLPKGMAVKLATKTLQSAAACLLESGKHATELRDQCTSPSGPAIYGIYMLDQKDTGSGLATAVEGAFRRLRELVDVVRN